MRNSRQNPSVNAGSMADIAFLLLIFFLVTTTIANDKGIVRGLPEPCPPNTDCNLKINERNVLRINLNEVGDLMVNKKQTDIRDLRMVLKNFIDNNGDESCGYCFGSRVNSSSDNPQLAAISITTHPKTPYKYYILIQDELTKAYFELRETYVIKILKKDVADLTSEDIKTIKDVYPFRISEADLE